MTRIARHSAHSLAEAQVAAPPSEAMKCDPRMPDLESRPSQIKEGLIADARRELTNLRSRGILTEKLVGLSKLIALVESFICGVSESVNVPIEPSRDEDDGAIWVPVKKVSYSQGRPNPGFHSESYVRQLIDRGLIPFQNPTPGRFLVDRRKVPKKMVGSQSAKNG